MKIGKRLLKSTQKPNEAADPATEEDGSMDTILASIRRILNEDEVAPAEAAPARPEPKAAELRIPALPTERTSPPSRSEASGAKTEMLVLKETMMVPPEKTEPAAPRSPSASSAPAPASPEIAEPATPPIVPGAAIEGLVAARTRAATAQSFDALHDALRRDHEPAGAPSSPALLRAGGPTVEDLVRDELRGLLSTWLDVHLPGLVETLVRLEIEKLTRR